MDSKNNKKQIIKINAKSLQKNHFVIKKRTGVKLTTKTHRFVLKAKNKPLSALDDSQA